MYGVPLGAILFVVGWIVVSVIAVGVLWYFDRRRWQQLRQRAPEEMRQREQGSGGS